MKMSEMLTWRRVMDKTIADRLKEINQELTKIKNDLAPYEPRANEIKNLKNYGK